MDWKIRTRQLGGHDQECAHHGDGAVFRTCNIGAVKTTILQKIERTNIYEKP